jgi:NAD+ kinase
MVCFTEQMYDFAGTPQNCIFAKIERMKIALYSRPEIEHQAGELAGFLQTLDRYGIRYCANTEFARIIVGQTARPLPQECVYDAAPPDDVEMIISYGGDGTFLDTVRRLDTRPIPVLGINHGHLGFLANVSRENVEEAIRDIAEGNYTRQERLLLQVEGDFPEPVDYPYAFNEFSLQKKGIAMTSIEAYIDGEPVARFQGDGLILSTPTGSTAYSLSVGGPILTPDCRCFVLAPIASHNLTLRPLVVPDDSELRFRVVSRTGEAIVTLDSREYSVPSGSGFTVKKAKKSAFLVELQNISFYRTLRGKMMWGMDSRSLKDPV